MSFHPVKVKEESYPLFEYILEGLYTAKEYKYPSNMTSPYSKAKYFKKHNPKYHAIPNALIRGLFKFGRITSDGMVGLRPKNDKIHIWGLGHLHLERPVSNIYRKISQISLRDNYTVVDKEKIHSYEVIVHGIGRVGATNPIIMKDYEQTDLHKLVKEDPIFDYLKVNQVFTEYGFKKACAIRDVIAHFEENPNMTRRQMEVMGIRGDKLWELITNYQRSLSVWLRASSKPDECDILSKGQHKKKLDREWSLSEHLSPKDVDAGKLKNQSFDAQVFEHTKSDRHSFFT
jgi:hypothetical protein